MTLHHFKVKSINPLPPSFIPIGSTGVQDLESTTWNALHLSLSIFEIFWCLKILFSVIVTFGIMGMAVGTYVSIDQLVTDLSGGGNDTCVPANSTGFHSVWYPPKLV